MNELQGKQAANFLWHRHLSDSEEGLGLKYRALLAMCVCGPIATAASGASVSQVAGVGASELGETDQQELKQAQGVLMNMRRQSVTFVELPSVGGASGPKLEIAQLGKVWETMRLGHKCSKKNRCSGLCDVG